MKSFIEFHFTPSAHFLSKLHVSYRRILCNSLKKLERRGQPSGSMSVGPESMEPRSTQPPVTSTLVTIYDSRINFFAPSLIQNITVTVANELHVEKILDEKTCEYQFPSAPTITLGLWAEVQKFKTSCQCLLLDFVERSVTAKSTKTELPIHHGKLTWNISI